MFPIARCFIFCSIALCLFAGGIAGCNSNAVVEDRTIHFSGDGAAASFQHGNDGVYIQRDGDLVRILETDETVIASSTPLWSPIEKKVIFTTATALEENDDPGNVAVPDWDAAPDGRSFPEQAVRYTCWLSDQSDPDSEPRTLFSEVCRHVGYVAANLAVRWKPDGKSVLFLAAGTNDKHDIRSFNLENSNKSAPVFPHQAEHVIFDFSPNGRFLTSLCQSTDKANPTDGLWVGTPDGNGNGFSWWHVSSQLVANERPQAVTQANVLRGLFSGALQIGNASPLENLRAQRPAWKADDSALAFVTDTGNGYAISLAATDDQSVETLVEINNPIADLAWNTDNKTLGLLRFGEQPRACLLRDGANELVAASLSENPARKFCGWNSDGQRGAIVATQPVRQFAVDDDKTHVNPWAMLFFADPFSRDELVVGDVKADGRFGNVRSPLQGFRVTFPNWSPANPDELSCWVTFTPTYQSIYSMLLNGMSARVDPAVIVNTKTNALRWMPVNGTERIQLGHYYARNQNWPDAQREYQAALDQLPLPDSRETQAWERTVVSRAIALVGLAMTLEQQDAKQEAFAKFQAAQTEFSKLDPHWEQAENERQVTASQAFTSEFGLSLLQDLQVTELLTSLELDDSRLLHHELQTARSNARKLAAALALSQESLLGERFEEYLKLATAQIIPLAVSELERLQPELPVAVDFMQPDNEASLIVQSVGQALMPLFSVEFQNQLDQQKRSKLLADIESLRSKVIQNELGRFACDLILRAAKTASGKQSSIVFDRISLPVEWDPAPESIAEFVRQMRDCQQPISPFASGEQEETP